MPILVSIPNIVDKVKVRKKTVKAAGVGKYAPWGLQEADVVYEQVLYGYYTTRMLALFHDALAEGTHVACGPVRSARPGQMSVREEWQGILVYTAAYLKENDITRRFAAVQDTYGFSVLVNEAWSRNMKAPKMESRCVDLNVIMENAPEKTASNAQPFLFDEFAGMDSSLPLGTSVEVDWQYEGYCSSFVYDESAGAYLRYSNGAPYISYLTPEDFGDGDWVQLAFENVVIQQVAYEYTDNSKVRPVPQLVGEGEAWVLTGGRLIACRWVRESDEGPTRFFDADGKQVAFRPGKTFIVHFPEGEDGIRFNVTE